MGFLPQLKMEPHKYGADETRIFVYDNESFYYNKSETLVTYMWKKSTIEKYDWEEIREKNIYDTKLVYTFKELKAMNFIITYNGD